MKTIEEVVEKIDDYTVGRPKSERCHITCGELFELTEKIIEIHKAEQERIDKIRAEIEAKCCITVGRENDGAITLHDVFEIIDKYMAEGSEKE